jgi:hemin uptake protein HemP
MSNPPRPPHDRPVAEPAAPQGPTPVAPALPRWASRTLLAGGREAEIEHDTVVYRLRLTSLGKLILTK